MEEEGVNTRDCIDCEYTMRYFLPEGVTCERCVLQFQYVTGNSQDKYPEAFWNCADIKIVACSTAEECAKIASDRAANEAAQGRMWFPSFRTNGNLVLPSDHATY